MNINTGEFNGSIGIPKKIYEEKLSSHICDTCFNKKLPEYKKRPVNRYFWNSLSAFCGKCRKIVKSNTYILSNLPLNRG